jgi:hypothetical protein
MDVTGSRSLSLTATLVWTVALLSAALLVACGEGKDGGRAAKQDLQTVSFQQPEDSGPDPFTRPADLAGSSMVSVSASGGGSQPFGGSGSNRVCDRDKLIRFLTANPDRMREWARVLGVSPTVKAVKRYIGKLHPVTLTRDTRITNHAFRAGRAVPFQAILQAGTAVLVDKYGAPVVRCYCGNPLTPAVFVKRATCAGCPSHYRPPKQCEYGRSDNYNEAYYRRGYYSNLEYDSVFISLNRRSRYRHCYEAYPDPPVVTIVQVFSEPQAEPAAPPSVAPAPTEPAPTVTGPAPTATGPAPTATAPSPAPPPPQAQPECDVPHFRANGCADITDKGTAPGIQQAP